MDVKQIHISVTILTFFSLCYANQLTSFKQLQDVDNELSSFITNYLIDTIKHYDSGLDDIEKEALQNLELGGSMKEGSMTARVFQPIGTKGKLNREFDANLEYTLMDIPVSSKRLVEDIAGKDGFVKIRMDKKLLYHAKLGSHVSPKAFESFLSKVTKNGYIKPNRVKEEAFKKIKVQDRDDEIKLLLSAALDIELDRITLKLPPPEISDTVIGSYVNILIDNEVKLTILWDIQPLIKLNWWPKVATEWIKRDRKWPSAEDIAYLTRVSYISTNPSAQGKATSDLIYSFSNIERVLASKRSTQQAFVYLLFKSILYKRLKPLDSRQVHSYIAKTVMLWTCERYPPSDTLWSESSPTHALIFLFNELLKAVEEKKLPNYFIPKMNVIENMKGDIREKLTHQIKHILSNIDQVLPDNVNEAVITYREILNMLKSTHQVIDDVRREYYDIFIKRPDLIPKAIEIYGSQLLSIGSKKKEEINQKFDDLKDSINEKWNQFTEDVNVEDVKENVKEKIEQVKEHFNLNDWEKKAKDFLKKFEL